MLNLVKIVGDMERDIESGASLREFLDKYGLLSDKDRSYEGEFKSLPLYGRIDLGCGRYDRLDEALDTLERYRGEADTKLVEQIFGEYIMPIVEGCGDPRVAISAFVDLLQKLLCAMKAAIYDAKFEFEEAGPTDAAQILAMGKGIAQFILYLDSGAYDPDEWSRWRRSSRVARKGEVSTDEGCGFKGFDPKRNICSVPLDDLETQVFLPVITQIRTNLYCYNQRPEIFERFGRILSRSGFSEEGSTLLRTVQGMAVRNLIQTALPLEIVQQIGDALGVDVPSDFKTLIQSKQKLARALKESLEWVEPLITKELPRLERSIGLMDAAGRYFFATGFGIDVFSQLVSNVVDEIAWMVAHLRMRENAQNLLAFLKVPRGTEDPRFIAELTRFVNQRRSTF